MSFCHPKILQIFAYNMISSRRQQITHQKLKNAHTKNIEGARRKNRIKTRAKPLAQLVDVDDQIKKIQQTTSSEQDVQQSKIDVLQDSAAQGISRLQQKIAVGQNLQNIQQTVAAELKVNDNVQNTYTSNKNNYIQSVKKYCQIIGRFNADQAQDILKRYTNLPTNRIIRSSTLNAKLSILKSRAQSYQNGWPSANRILSIISQQKKMMQFQPSQWYQQYLLYNKKLQPDSQQFQNQLQSHQNYLKALEERQKYLDGKEAYVKSHIYAYGNKLQAQKLDRVSKLIELSQSRQQMNMAHKKILLFTIQQQKQNINKLNNQLNEIEDKFMISNEELNKKRQKLKLQQQENSNKQMQINILQDDLKNDKKLIGQQQMQIKKIEQSLILLTKQVNRENNEISLLKAQNFQLRKQNYALRQKNALNTQQLINYKKTAQLEFDNAMKAAKQRINKQQQQLKRVYENQKSQVAKNIQQKQNLIKAYDQKIRMIDENSKKQLISFKQRIQKQLNAKIIQNNDAWSLKISLQQVKYRKQLQQAKKLIKDKQKQFQQYIIKSKQQLNKLKVQHQKKLQDLNMQKQKMKKKYGEQSQQYKKHIQLTKITEKKLKSQIQINLRDIAQTQKASLVNLKNSQEKYLQAQIKASNALKQLQNSSRTYETLKMNLQKQIVDIKNSQKLRKQQQQKKAVKTKKSYQNQVQKLKKQMQKRQSQGVIKFFRWRNDHSQTIRQCFKSKQTNKWICSTRGISYNIDQSQNVMAIIQKWAQSNPLSQKKIEGMLILQIIDIYKSKKYFSLREGYYYNNKLEPTRRGFNVQQSHLDQFKLDIQKIFPNQNIENLQ